MREGDCPVYISRRQFKELVNVLNEVDRLYLLNDLSNGIILEDGLIELVPDDEKCGGKK